MGKEIKKVELINGKQLFEELKHFTHNWMGAITIRISGTITPIEIRSSTDFQDTDLFEMNTANPMRDLYLPTYKILCKDLWCPALKQEIIGYLEAIPSNYNYMDYKIAKLAIPYIITLLRRESKTKELSLPEKNKLVGELRADNDFHDLNIVGNVLFANGEQKEIEFLKLEKIFCIWAPFSDPTTRVLRKNKKLWTQELTNLIISLLAEIIDFIGDRYKGDIEKAKRILRGKSEKAKFCNQLRDGLLKTDDTVLQDPQVLEAFRTIATICDFNLNSELLAIK